jgi:parallel beta-helix repeat protein
MTRRFAHLAVCVAISILLITTSALAGTIIHVPANQPTIQAGINAANDGDTVLVAPGTYVENINFFGKAITVRSSGGTKVTIIDGAQNGAVVTFANGETNASILQGFTVQNGNYVSGVGEGGGISVEGSSPTIIKNTITNNKACEGNGIGVGFGSPIIQTNVITNNSNAGCGGIGGAGIGLRGASSAQIIGNTISNNSADSYGGGIALWSANAVLIQNNVISGNTAGNNGGGISMFNDTSSVIVVQNLIKGNRAPTGNGVYWSNPPSAFVNNTIVDSPLSSGGSTVWADGFGYPVKIVNNVIVASGGAINAFTCNYADFPTLTFTFNDAFSTKGAAYSGMCTDQTGTNGNISANPKFIGSSNLRLKGGSPAIDVGSNSAPDLPSKDLANNPRIINGNGGSTAIVDMGAYEFVAVVLAPKSLSFGLHAIGSTTSKTVKLTNAQNKVLNISSYSVPPGYSVTGCGTSVAAFTSCTLTVTFHPLTSGTFKGVLSIKDNAGNSPQTVSLSGSAQ